jgi:hypothetical protein
MKKSFDGYRFLIFLKSNLLDEISNNNLCDMDEAWTFIHEAIENEIIYYADCFDICKDLNFTDFTGHELGDATNICQAAYFALYDWINEQFDFSEIEEAIEAKQLEEN